VYVSQSTGTFLDKQESSKLEKAVWFVASLTTEVGKSFAVKI
jgi:hypothetical protein